MINKPDGHHTGGINFGNIRPQYTGQRKYARALSLIARFRLELLSSENHAV
jgi:hypothetical protein